MMFLTVVMIIAKLLAAPVQSDFVPPAASLQSTDITIGDIAIWTGLPDGQAHTIAVYKSGLASKPFVVEFGTYMDTNDVGVPLTDNGDGSWSGTVQGAGTVTVSWNGRLVHVEVSAGRVQTERQYLCM